MLLAVAAALSLALGAARSARATTWSPAEVVAPVPPSYSPYPFLSMYGNYQVAMSGDGTATAIWVDIASSPDGSIMSATRAAGTTTWVPKRVSPTGNFSYGEASALAVADDGTTTVLWQTGGNIFAATRPAGGTEFSAPATLSSSGNAGYPAVGAAKDGTVVAAWQEYDPPSGTSSVTAARRAPGDSTFGAPQRLSSPTLSATITNQWRYLSVAPDGTAAITWLEQGTNVYRVKAAVLRPGQSNFDPSQEIGDDVAGTSNDNPTIAAGPNGSAVAAWEFFDGSGSGQTYIRTQSQAAGSTSFSPTLQDLPGTAASTNNGLPAVATNGKRAVIAWRYRLGGGGDPAYVRTAIREPGEASFGHEKTLTALADPGVQGPPQPGLAIAADSTAIVTWLSATGGDTSASSSTLPAGGSEFGSPQELFAPNSDYFGAWSFAMAGNGSAVLLWSGGSTGLKAAVSDPITYTVAAGKSGDGSGTITSVPAGIDCGTTCSANVALSSEVTLTANPASGSTFTGWSGACSGNSKTCTLTVLGDLSATAAFSKDNPPNPVPPSSDFKVTSTRVSGSSAATRVRVTGAGKINQRGTYRLAGVGSAATRTACTTSRTATTAGTYTLTCRLNAAARRQRAKGALRVRVLTTFTPTGGAPRSALRTVVFRSLKPRYTG